MRNQISEKNVLEICSKQYELQSSEKKHNLVKTILILIIKKEIFLLFIGIFLSEKRSCCHWTSYLFR